MIVILPFMTFRINFQSQRHHFNKEKKIKGFLLERKEWVKATERQVGSGWKVWGRLRNDPPE